jgi:hypothetical protein
MDVPGKFNCSGRMIERACASLQSQSSKMSDDEEVEKVLTGACARILHWPICVHALFKLAVTPLASAPCCLALCTVLLLKRDGIARGEWEGVGGRKREGRSREEGIERGRKRERERWR